MNTALSNRIASGLEREVSPAVRAFAESLGHQNNAIAVLFYGSNLRTGELEGVLDYYLLLPGEPEQGVWPRVSYHEWQHEGVELRAKAASMTLAKFEQAASGELLDTTIWARFVQPSALIWCSGDDISQTVISSLAKASATAAKLAVVLGPPSGTEDEYWTALFKATYGAEFRIETQSRAQSILDLNRSHFEGLLPLALDEAGIAFESHGDKLTPSIGPSERNALKRWWSRRRMAGKPINVLRLIRAASTFEGASRYAAWKIERHTGIPVEVTPWREKHPVLAAPGVMFSIWRRRRQVRRTDP